MTTATRRARSGQRPHLLMATVRRILQQLRHDPRTIGMIIGVPIMLIALLYSCSKGCPADSMPWP